jgi:hypothetical protein
MTKVHFIKKAPYLEWRNLWKKYFW